MGAYADPTYARAYFATALSRRALPWLNATTSDQLAALEEATRAIDVLNYGGHKNDRTATGQFPNQINQFPRGNDTIVPDEISRACCELALAFLDDVDPELEMENLTLGHQGVGAARIVRDTSYAQEHVRNGIPSLRAWLLLKPFLRDNMSGDLSRG